MTCHCDDLAVWETPCSPDECGCDCHPWHSASHVATAVAREVT